MKNTTIRHCAVIGNPISHSLSPKIHHAFAAQIGLPIYYERLTASIENFDTTVRNFLLNGGYGLNITIPFKQMALNLLNKDKLSKKDCLGKSINTLWSSNGILCGCNTDGIGLVNDLKLQGFCLKNSRILLIGSGGAASGVLPALIESGCKHIHIINRNPERAHILSDSFRRNSSIYNKNLEISSGDFYSVKTSKKWQLVINATSSSLQGIVFNLPDDLYTAETFAYDMMYDILGDTAFIRQAKSLGAINYSDGLGMLVAQAAESFSIWHGQYPDSETVLRSLRKGQILN